MFCNEYISLLTYGDVISSGDYISSSLQNAPVWCAFIADDTKIAFKCCGEILFFHLILFVYVSVQI